MKGDFNIVSIVLISGIIIALMGAAYLWSVPLLEKGRASTIFQSSSAFTLSLNDKIIDIANTGGETTLEIPTGFLTLYPHDYLGEENNSLFYDVVFPQALAVNNSKTYLGEATFLDVVNSSTGTFAESSPSIVTFSLSPLGTAYQGTYQIFFRKLVTATFPIKGFKIVFNLGSAQKLTGGSVITIRNEGQVTIPPDTTFTKIGITLV